MPSKATTQRARAKQREGYASSTAAGEFVREEMHHRMQRKHGPESRKQAIAIGLSKARKAGIPVARKPARRRPAMKRRPRSS